MNGYCVGSVLLLLSYYQNIESSTFLAYIKSQINKSKTPKRRNRASNKLISRKNHQTLNTKCSDFLTIFFSFTQISDVFSYTPWLNVIYPLVYRKYPKIARLFRSNAPGLLNLRWDIFVTLRKNEEENERKSERRSGATLLTYVDYFFWERENCLFLSFFFHVNLFRCFHIHPPFYVL